MTADLILPVVGVEMLDENSSDEERFDEIVRRLELESVRDLADVRRAARRRIMRNELNGIVDEAWATAPGAEEFEILADLSRELLVIMRGKFEGLNEHYVMLGVDRAEREAIMERARAHLGSLLTYLMWHLPNEGDAK
jgi:hypothetical protein